MEADKLVRQYNLNDTIHGNTPIVYKDTIEIFNNEQFTLDFTGLSFICSDSTVGGTEIIKIKVDWGDGESDTLGKRLLSVSSSIGFFQEIEWKTVKHTFNTDKRNVYLTDDIKALPKIAVSVYNTFNDVVKIYIPYKLVYKSIYDLGTDFMLVDGNITNTNHSSFVVKNNSTDALMVVSVKDWKKIYGNDEIVYISDDEVSVDYSDEFVNEENIIWDWDSVPTIALNVVVATDNTTTYFTGNFDEKNVNLQSWKAKCFKLMDDGEEQLVKVIENKRYRTFEIFNIDEDGKVIPLSLGMYKIYLQLTGINGIDGNSEIIYIKSDEDGFYADTLERPMGKDLVTSTGAPEHYIIVKYTLPDFAQVSHLKYAKMFLQSTLYDDSDDGLGLNFTQGEKLSFEYNLEFGEENKKTQNGELYYQMKIPASMIPNGEYTIRFQVKELTKDNQANAEQRIFGYTTVTQQNPQTGEQEEVVKRVELSTSDKQVVVNYNYIGQFVDQVTPNVTVDEYNVNVSWQIKNPTEMDMVNYRIAELYFDEEGGEWKTKRYITDRNQFYKSYFHEVITTQTNDVIYKFTESIPVQSLVDTRYIFSVGHIIPMAQYTSQRQINSINEYNFTYPTPIIRVEDAFSYLKRQGTTYTPFFKLYLDNLRSRAIENAMVTYYDYSDRNLQNATKRQVVANNLECDISALASYSPSLILSATANDILDKEYKRIEANPLKFELQPILEVAQDLKDMQDIVQTHEHMTTYGVYQNVTTEKEHMGYNLIQSSSYNLKKKHKWVDPTTNEEYYSSIENPTFYRLYEYAVNKDDRKHVGDLQVVFKGQTYRERNADQASKLIYRYHPVIGNVDLTAMTHYVLPTVKEYIASKQLTVDTVYDKTNDRMSLKVSSKNPMYQKDIKQIGDLKIIIKNEKGDYNYSIDLRDDFNLELNGLKVDKYDLQLDLQSSNTDSISSTKYTCGWDNSQQYDEIIPNLFFKVKASQAFGYQQSLVDIIDRKYVTVSWNQYHKALNNPTLHWKWEYHYTVQQQQFDSQGKPILDSQGKPVFKEVEHVDKGENSRKLNVYNSSHELGCFEDGTIIDYWFTFTSDHVDWTNETKGRYPKNNVRVTV